jgi:uncharacterized protein (DUF1501 family)
MFRNDHAASLSRRDWLRLSCAGVLGASVSGWLGAMADDAARDPQRRRACVLLWMNGGPSQMDTFDLKPGHANGGPFREIATAVPGIRISEHLPRLARHFDKIALVRSMTSREGEHGQATFFAHTGYAPRGPIQYPPVGAHVARQLGRDDADLPNFVSIAPNRTFSQGAYGPGFLGPRYAPLIVGESSLGYQPPGGDASAGLQVENLGLPVGTARPQFESRLQLAQELQRDFVRQHPDAPAQSHQTAYDRAVRLMSSAAARALNVEAEPTATRDAYGRNLFGQGCLLARRLIERSVPFVEVTLGGLGGIGWDTHNNNFETVRNLSGMLDAAWSQLLHDLDERGLLEQTLLVWMGEFGRTPHINSSNGRDHYPTAWTAALAGGGIRGGQVIGRTSADGTQVEEQPVTVPGLLATVYQALGIDATRQNRANTGRPIALLEAPLQPIRAVLR